MIFMRHAAAAIVLGSAAVAAQAAPTTIDFDDLADNVVVGANYAGLGVTFVDAETGPFGGLPGGSAPRAIVHDTLFSTFGPANPISAIFAFGVTSVSITGIDVGEAGMVMTAYDAAVGGNVIDTDSFVGVGIGVGDFHTLTLTGAGIRRVEFSQIAAGRGADGIAFDNLVFDGNQVPAPAPAALVALGLLAAGLTSRRKG